MIEEERVAEEVAKDNASELIVKKYSIKLRIRTVLLFLVLLAVIFICLGTYVGTSWKAIFNSYEGDVSMANGRSIIDNIVDEVSSLQVKKKKFSRMT